MTTSEESNNARSDSAHPSTIWLENVVSLADGYEAEAVNRFAQRMIALARTRLPKRLARRVDPEDIVQSALNSFFHRNQAGQYKFENSSDLWRLLAAITYHKVLAKIEFHGRKRRNYSLDVDAPRNGTSGESLPHHVDLLRDREATASAVVVMSELLEGILDEMPEIHQEILKLRLENYSIEEIAIKVNVSTRTVDRALKKVRRLAEKHLYQDDD